MEVVRGSRCLELDGRELHLKSMSMKKLIEERHFPQYTALLICQTVVFLVMSILCARKHVPHGFIY